MIDLVVYRVRAWWLQRRARTATAEHERMATLLAALALIELVKHEFSAAADQRRILRARSLLKSWKILVGVTDVLSGCFYDCCGS